MNRHKGFTLIELMFTLLIVAISVSLAIPSYQAFREKRKLTAAAEDITSYVAYAQSLAIKKGQPVSFAWKGSSSHSADFCIGLSAPPRNIPCDCRVTDTDSDDQIDSSGAGSCGCTSVGSDYQPSAIRIIGDIVAILI